MVRGREVVVVVVVSGGRCIVSVRAAVASTKVRIECSNAYHGEGAGRCELCVINVIAVVEE